MTGGKYQCPHCGSQDLWLFRTTDQVVGLQFKTGWVIDAPAASRVTEAWELLCVGCLQSTDDPESWGLGPTEKAIA